MEHSLKTWPAEHDAVGSGAKTFDVRSNTDRSFGVGDILLLRRWDPSYVTQRAETGSFLTPDGTSTFASKAYTHRCQVTYVLHGGRFGVSVGMCVMAFVLIGDEL